MNPLKLLQLKSAWETFQANHPKFPLFLKSIGQDALQEGTILEFTVKTADGKTYCSNLKLTQSDIELFQQMKDMTAD